MWTADHRYIRTFENTDGPTVIAVEQKGARTLVVTIHGGADDARMFHAVRRMLGSIAICWH